MNSISLYFLLMLVYLGLSRSLGMTLDNDAYIKSGTDLALCIDATPMNIILIDMEVSGVFFKSYFHKYRVVFGNGDFKDYWFKVSWVFYQQNSLHLGLSLFRRYQKDLAQEAFPMMPVAFFLGDLTYGSWLSIPKSDKKIWKFHDLYHRLPVILGLEDTTLDSGLYEQIQMHQSKKRPYVEVKGLFLDRVRRVNAKINNIDKYKLFKQTYFTLK